MIAEPTAELRTLVADMADLVRPPAGADLEVEPALLALAAVESSGGTNLRPMFEPAYAGPGPHPERHKGGFYYRRAGHVRIAWRRWGDIAAMSFDAWQLLYITALEMGLSVDTDPASLRPLGATAHLVVRLLNRRVFKSGGARDMAGLLDAWNTGTARDERPPAAGYTADGLAAYNHFRLELTP